MLCDSRIAAATRKNDGCGLGVPCRNMDIPRRACTLKRSVFRIVSSVSTPMAFLRYIHAFWSSSCGTRLLMTRSRCAIANATLMLAHHPLPSYGVREYCMSTKCMNVGSWNSGNMQLKFSKKSLSKDMASSRGGKGLDATDEYVAKNLWLPIHPLVVI